MTYSPTLGRGVGSPSHHVSTGSPRYCCPLKSSAYRPFRNHTGRPLSSTINGPCCPRPNFGETKTLPGARPCARVLTATTGGSRSGRERKFHARPAGPDEAFGAGHTRGKSADPPPFGVLAFETCSRGSHPVRARPVTPAPMAARNRRRVNL